MTIATRILAATDFSPTGDRALEEGARLARATGAGFVIVHAVPREPESLRLIDSSFSRADVQNSLERRARKALQDRSGESDPEMKIEIHVRTGKPAPAIMKAAAETEADLVVVGHEGSGVVDRLLLGSVAFSLVRSAPQRVLVVRAPSRPIRNILVALDLTDFSPVLLAEAVRWARAEGAMVHVLYAWEAAGLAEYTSAMPSVPGGNIDQVIVDSARTRLQGLVEEAGASGLTVHTYVRPGAASQEVTELADKLDSCMVVIGSHGRQGFSRMFLGNTAERVLRRAQVNVLVLKPSPDAEPAAEDTDEEWDV